MHYFIKNFLMFKSTMNGRQGSRRRTTRNKTILIDASILLDDEVLSHPASENILPNKIEESKNVIDNRSFSFKELMDAFKTIEKNVADDRTIAQKVLGKFQEDNKVKYDYINSPNRNNSPNFPKISNNPFLQKDQEFNNEKSDFNVKRGRNL